MKKRLTIFDQLEHLHLSLEYLDDLPDHVFGYLDPSDEPCYIAVNQNHSRSEQIFTIAHEIGHYLKHHNRPPRRWFARQLQRYQGKRKMNILFRYYGRRLSRIFTKEFEADLYACCLLIGLGEVEVLNEFGRRHPDKYHVLWLGIAGSTYATARSLITLPFRIVSLRRIS